MNRRTWMTAVVAGLAVLPLALPAAAQGPGRGGPGRGGFGGGPGLAGLIRMPEVQAELKVDAAQKELLNAIQPGRGNRGNREDFRNMSPEELQRRFAEMRAEQEKKIAEVLDAKQMARLKQLELQQLGVRAVDRKDVADTLKLNQEQRAKIAAAIQGERQAMRDAFGGFQGGQRPSPEEIQARMQKLQETRQATDAKLNAVLTPAQQNQLKQMQGAPFKFPERRFGPGGRPGRGNPPAF